MVRLVGPAAILLLVACDPRVSPTAATEARAAGPGAAVSTLGESCGTTAHCEAGLRCVEEQCAPGKASRLGDFHHAAGRLALAKGDASKAAEAFATAVGAYEGEKLPVPAALLCDSGAALRRKGSAKAAEQAARLLHRCVLAAPPASTVYRMGMNELAELELDGLDPVQLAKDAPGDTYLTKPVQRKPAEAKLEVTASGATPRDKGYAAFVARLGLEGRAALQACHKAAGKPTVTVPLELKYRQVLGDDDIVVGVRFDVRMLPGGDAAAGSCVRDAVVAQAKEFGQDKGASSGNWEAQVAVKLAVP